MAEYALPFSGSYPINSPFGDGTNRSFVHQGIDYGLPQGTPVLASNTGVVKTAGLSGLYGNLVSIDSLKSGNLPQSETRYGHLSHIDVHVGQMVQQGSQIGLSGGKKGTAGAGDATGPHLHFEIRINGKAVDPAKYLGSANPEFDNSLPGQVTQGVSSMSNIIGSLTPIIGNLGDPKFWIRVGLFTLGAILVTVVLVKLFNETDTGKAIASNVKQAASMATTAATVA